MAGQDFAHIERPSQTSTSTVPRKGLLIAISVILAVLLSGGAGYLIADRSKHRQAAAPQQTEQLQSLQQQLKQSRQALEAARIEIAKLKEELELQRPPELGELTFYSELPKQQVLPESARTDLPDTPKAHNLPKPSASPVKPKESAELSSDEQQIQQIFEQEMGASTSESGNYFLQIGSFVKQEDAQKLVEWLNRKGVQSEIQQADIASLGTRYRVLSIAGSKHQMTTLKEKLQSLKISTLMRKKT